MWHGLAHTSRHFGSLLDTIQHTSWTAYHPAHVLDNTLHWYLHTPVQPAGYHPARTTGLHTTLVPTRSCPATWTPSSSCLDCTQSGTCTLLHTGPYARGNDFGSPLIATGVVMLMHIAFCQLPPAEVIPDHGGTGHAPLGTIARTCADYRNMHTRTTANMADPANAIALLTGNTAEEDCPFRRGRRLRS